MKTIQIIGEVIMITIGAALGKLLWNFLSGFGWGTGFIVALILMGLIK